MTEINWCSLDAAFRKGGLVNGLKELKRQGYVIVPAAPTDAMLEAGEAEDRDAAPWSGYATEYARCEDHYAAMIAVGEVTA